MVIPIPECLETIDAGGFAGRRTFFHDLASYRDDFFEAAANLVQQPRTSRHRVPQQSIHFLSIDMPNDKYLKVFHVHVEHPGRAEPQRFQDAVCGGLIRTGRQRDGISYHVGIKPDRIYLSATALQMRLLELLALLVG